MQIRRPAKWLNSTAIAVLLFGAPLGVAGAPSRAAAAEAVAQTGDVSLEEVKVTARRRQERLIDVPVSATAVTATTLARSGTTNIGELNTLVPNVSFDKATSGSGATLAMRGISSSSVDAGVEQSISVEIDGMQISRGRILNDGLFDIQSVDVLKGPQALYFGKNSPGGVVSITSQNPGRSFEGYAKAGYEFETHAPYFEGAVGGPINDVWSARIAIAGTHTDGYIKNLAQPIQSPLLNETQYVIPVDHKELGAEEKIGARLTVVYRPNDTFEANFKLFGSLYKSDGLASLGEIMSCPGGAQHPTDITRTSFAPSTFIQRVDPFGDCTLNATESMGTIPKQVGAAFPLWQKAGGQDGAKGQTALPTLTMTAHLPHVTLTSVTGYYYNDFWNAGTTDGTVFANFEVVSHDVNNVFVQELRASTSYDFPINFSGGLLYEDTHRNYFIACRCQTFGPNPHPGFADNGRTDTDSLRELNVENTYSAYGQMNWTIVPTLELAAGARYTYETMSTVIGNDYVHQLQLAAYKTAGVYLTGSRSEDNVSPEVTLTWHVTRHAMLYGAYKTGYLAGTYSNPGNLVPARTIDQLVLKPVEAKGGEIGAKTSLFDGALNADLTIYHYEYDGLQLTAYDVASNSVITKNAAAAIVEGAELQARYRVNADLSVHGDASYNHGYYGSFANAQCYAGQTAATGCLPNAAHVNVQNLTGAPLQRSPKFTWDLGAVYDHPIAGGFKVDLTGDLHGKSSYYALVSENPGSLQKAYTTVDASIALSPANGPWEVRLIGRNLTNVYYGTAGADKPGGIGETIVVLGETRRVMLQFSTKF